ncbi:MAG: glycosyltransferase family 4 protein [Pseudomonadota bacterium]
MTDRATRIALLGAYPPVYGGISVHVWRLHQTLKATHTVDVLDMYSSRSAPAVDGVHRLAGNPMAMLLGARRLLSRLRADILHVHVSAFKKFLLTAPVLLTGGHHRARILTIHGGKLGQNLEAFAPWQLRLFDWTLTRFDHIVCVSEAQRQLLLERGIDAERMSVINAYLPPVPHTNSAQFGPLEQRRRDGKRILLVAAQFLPHYGLLDLLEALHQLPSTLRETVCLAHVSYLDADDSYRAACLDAVGDLDYVAFDNLEPPDMAAWMALGDVFVRPTWWDGDAVSLREACFFNNRVVATDVTTRPEGAVLCAARDSAGLAAALQQVLADDDAGTVSFDHLASQRLLESVYATVLG